MTVSSTHYSIKIQFDSEKERNEWGAEINHRVEKTQQKLKLEDLESRTINRSRKDTIKFKNRSTFTTNISRRVSEMFTPVNAVKKENNASQTDWKTYHLFGIETNEGFLYWFGCALRGSIQIQGRIYIFEKHLGFYSNMLNHETKEVIDFTGIIAVEKQNSAFFIPNAIEISTIDNKKYVFTSFIHRDEAFQQIIAVWEQNMAYSQLHATSSIHSTTSPTSDVSSESS